MNYFIESLKCSYFSVSSYIPIKRYYVTITEVGQIGSLAKYLGFALCIEISGTFWCKNLERNNLAISS